MTVSELLSLNQHIVDLAIEVRGYPESGKLLEALYIGMSAGVEPPYPTMIGEFNQQNKRKAIYKRTSINSWDDGRDYWHTNVNKIPKQFLDLEVFSWNRADCYRYMPYHRREDHTHSAECYLITTYRPKYDGLLEYPAEKIATEQKQIEGQMSIEDFLGGSE